MKHVTPGSFSVCSQIVRTPAVCTGRLSLSEGDGVGEGGVQRILRVSKSNPSP